MLLCSTPNLSRRTPIEKLLPVYASTPARRPVPPVVGSNATGVPMGRAAEPRNEAKGARLSALVGAYRLTVFAVVVTDSVTFQNPVQYPLIHGPTIRSGPTRAGGLAFGRTTALDGRETHSGSRVTCARGSSGTGRGRSETPWPRRNASRQCEHDRLFGATEGAELRRRPRPTAGWWVGAAAALPATSRVCEVRAFERPIRAQSAEASGRAGTGGAWQRGRAIVMTGPT